MYSQHFHPSTLLKDCLNSEAKAVIRLILRLQLYQVHKRPIILNFGFILDIKHRVSLPLLKLFTSLFLHHKLKFI